MKDKFYGRDWELHLEKNLGKFRKENAKLIKDFIRAKRADGAQIKHIDKLVWILLKLDQLLPVPFKKANREHIQDLVIKLNALTDKNGKPLTEWTRRDHKLTLKLFYRWLKDDEHPEIIKGIKTAMPKNIAPKPDDLLNEVEYERLINACENQRDKALVAVLFDTMVRIGEIASMKIGDVSNEKDGVFIKYTGKTGSNQVIAPIAGPYLLDYLKVHPQRNNPSAALWVMFQNGGAPLNYSAMRMQLQRIAERAGIKKRVNPHSWRKSSTAYWIKKGLTEPQLCKRGTWVMGSKAVRHYFSIHSKDADDAVLRVLGRLPQKKEKGIDLAPRKCSRCETENEHTREFCKTCGAALSVEAALRAEKKRERISKDEIDKLVERKIKEAFKQHFAKKK